MNKKEEDLGDLEHRESEPGSINSASSYKERMIRYLKQERENKQAKKSPVNGKIISAMKEQALEGVGFIFAILATLGIAVLLFRGCSAIGDAMRESGEANKERWLNCAYAGEKLDQIKRLRDSGVVNESAVRAVARERDEACR